ncbi:MAG: hypothetical protein JXO49_00735 [Deltaproteobacteria bacterium]|nr:hypothetical protein [Candidatus Anaeroferrophillus wilburensis]MBN2887851.1 hypothetical protein [Deltaproteobacteria bacterium]
MSYQNYMSAYAGYAGDSKPSAMEIVQSISFLTKLGALCLLTGKIFMVVAIAAVFIPALNAYAIPCTIIWGTLVSTTIILCSVDHYTKKHKAELAAETDPTIAALNALQYSYTPQELDHDKTDRQRVAA